jgi:hypothetical protein
VSNQSKDRKELRTKMDVTAALILLTAVAAPVAMAQPLGFDSRDNERHDLNGGPR